MKNYLFPIVVLLLFTACKQKKSDFILDYPEKKLKKEIITFHENGAPDHIYYYKIDENGHPTNEKIGEAFFYDDQKPYIGGSLKGHNRDGVWKAFHPNGTVWTEAFYIDGKEDGDYKVYYENGNLHHSEQYDNGICVGEWKFYNEQGKLVMKLKADKNTIVCGKCQKCQSLVVKK